MVENKIDVKTEFIEKFLNEHSFLIKDFAKFQNISEEKARELAKEEIKEALECYLYEEKIENYEDFEEQLIEYIENLDERYLWLEIAKVNFDENEVIVRFWVAFGNPNWYFEAAYNFDRDSFDFINEDDEFYDPHSESKKRTMRSFVHFLDFLLVTWYDGILKAWLHYELKDKMEELLANINY